MKEILRRSCAVALVFLALLSVAPPLIPSDTDGLPGFDDTDDADGPSPPALFRCAVAALPTPTPRLDGLVVLGALHRAFDARSPEDVDPGTLSSRAPPSA